jgi:hypothetical protein
LRNHQNFETLFFAGVSVGLRLFVDPEVVVHIPAVVVRMQAVVGRILVMVARTPEVAGMQAARSSVEDKPLD